MVLRGFSDDAGSWNTILAVRCSSRRCALTAAASIRVSPTCRRMRPEVAAWMLRMVLPGWTCRSHSPTTPMVSPWRSSKLTPSTARSVLPPGDSVKCF